MRLPDFLIIGAMRAGTTTLYHLLFNMPDIYLPQVKELHFFDNRNDVYKKGLNYYSSFFEEAKADQLCGECTPIYLFLEESCLRISKTLANVKLIVILREPIARAWSHYRYSVMYGPETLSFEKALQKEDARLRTGKYKNIVYFSYRKRGEYVDQLIMYENLFAKDQILVVFLEELKTNPNLVASKIRSHLGLKPLPNYDFFNLQISNELKKFPRSSLIHQMSKSWKSISGDFFTNKAIRKLGQQIYKLNLDNKTPRLKTSTRDYLKEYYSSYNNRLSKWLGYSTPWEKY